MSSSTAKLFALPFELREAIYIYYFDLDHVAIGPYHKIFLASEEDVTEEREVCHSQKLKEYYPRPNEEVRKRTNLMLTSRQIYTEATTTFYGRHEFRFKDHNENINSKCPPETLTDLWDIRCIKEPESCGEFDISNQIDRC